MENSDELGAFQFLEIRSTLPDELLMYADKLSMAHSLEVRVPYLDQEIVEYVERLPASFKIRYGTGKWLHREVCKNFLPREIIRRKKKGFAVNVVDEWFRHSMAGTMDNILLDRSSFMYKYLRPEKVGPLVRDHRAGRANNHKILFSLVAFEQWLCNIS
jgi:asparagine synthase (glutamine-hydrolysing)